VRTLQRGPPLISRFNEFEQVGVNRAYLLSYDCVQVAGGGDQEFPTEDLPELHQVELGSATCPPK
jgi:hypothetical protein